MDKVKNVLHKIGDFLGVFTPTVAFLTIFITFMISIVSRYILKHPVPWASEISVLAYMWTMFFATGKALDNEEHVMFGLVYDGLSPRGQKISRIIYYVLIALLLAIAFPACFTSLITKKGVTGVLKLSYSIVFAPFLWMFADVVLRCIRAIYWECKPDQRKEGNV